jgi:outer membrane protein assembly factor BamD
LSHNLTRHLFICIATLAAALAIVAGCSPIPNLGEATTADAYEVGKAAAERGDYLVAIEAYKRVIDQSPMSDLADSALIGLADAHRAMGDYVSAEAEYKQLVSDYPRSALIPEAEYKLGLTYFDQSLPPALDQSMTRQAIAQLSYFISTYPESEFVPDAREKVNELESKLASKDYDNAMLYFTLENPKAARVYLEAVARNYPDTVWARRAQLRDGRVDRARG